MEKHRFNTRGECCFHNNFHETLDNEVFDPRIKLESFHVKHSSTAAQVSIEGLLEQLKHEVIKKNEVQIRQSQKTKNCEGLDFDAKNSMSEN